MNPSLEQQLSKLVPKRLRDKAIARAAANDEVRNLVLARLARPQAMTPHNRALVEPLVRVFANDMPNHVGEEHSDWLVNAVCHAFRSLYAPTEAHAPQPGPTLLHTIVDQFHTLYYHADPHPWEATYYRGHRILKLPLDLWIYRVLIDELAPSLIIETGTRFGGSALWFADQLELLGHGQVVTIDIEAWSTRPKHPRITYLDGSSTDPAVHARIEALLPTDGGNVMVVLDSDHSRDHVLAELETLSRFVTPGSYLLVEDTNVNGHPVLPDFGPGPMEAVVEFLTNHTEFKRDASREMFYFTMHPQGFLRRNA